MRTWHLLVIRTEWQFLDGVFAGELDFYIASDDEVVRIIMMLMMIVMTPAIMTGWQFRDGVFAGKLIPARSLL